VTIFLRVLQAEDKGAMLLSAVREPRDESVVSRFELDCQSFRGLPGSTFAYWASQSLLQANLSLPHFEPYAGVVRVGVQTDDDARFVRASWEIAVRDPEDRADQKAQTRPVFLKGGASSPYYSNYSFRLRWDRNGRELKALSLQKWGSIGKRIYNESDFFRPGLSWALRTARFSPHVVPVGCVFSVSRYLAVPSRDDPLSVLAAWNSAVMDACCKLRMERHGHPKFIVGAVKTSPLPIIDGAAARTLSRSGRRGWSLKRGLDTRVEVSHAFVLPALLQVEGGSLAVRADAWAGRVRAVEAELTAIQVEIDECCFDLYGIDEADRNAISKGLTSDGERSDGEEPSAGDVDEADDEQDVEAALNAADLAAELLSWAVGVAFGRFDVRLATGERQLPDEPEPFDPLPVCSPGMLVGERGLPSTSAPTGYPLDFPASGVLVDDPGDTRDLAAAVRAVFDSVFGGSADAVWDEAAALLDPRGHELRAWIRSGFFEHHLKLHSKSRRKAPILWQLGTPSARYSVWLYAHRLTEDSLFQLQNDVLAPKLAYEERQLTNLVQSSGGSPSAKERREIDAQEGFVEELRVLLEEVKRVAPLWKPTLDDGIVLVMAPLWRLVPHKSWQRELKKKWAELGTGKYDWAQLAMHLWPERVVPKCAEDRSLAIAHGLEDVFWDEDEDGKWQPHEKPTAEVAELIQQRTSTAVKEALRGAV
jgi:hypothetical protein